jgi:hypothetical protein
LALAQIPIIAGALFFAVDFEIEKPTASFRLPG